MFEINIVLENSGCKFMLPRGNPHSTIQYLMGPMGQFMMHLE